MKRIIRLTERDLTRLVKQVIREFDYEPHKNKDLEIIDRFIISINPGSDDVIEMEGILARDNRDKHLMFKQLEDVKIFSSSNSRELIKDEEISLGRADDSTQRTAQFLNRIVGKWAIISSEGRQFYYEIPVGENINVSGLGVNYIGNLNCVFNNIKFETI
jgi:hypothetical protein